MIFKERRQIIDNLGIKKKEQLKTVKILFLNKFKENEIRMELIELSDDLSDYHLDPLPGLLGRGDQPVRLHLESKPG